MAPPPRSPRSPRLAALAAVTLLGLSSAQEPPREADQDRLGETLHALERALAHGGVEARAAALRAAGHVPHEHMARAVARALDDEESAVRREALRALRFMGHDSALDRLHAAARRFARDEELGPEWFLAVGQYGRERSLPVLLAGALNARGGRLLEARMNAIARVRSTRSVEELMDMWNRVGRQGRFGGGHAVHIQRALRLLTDNPEPRGHEEWRAWWRRNRTTFQVPPEPRNLPRFELAAWSSLWSAQGREGRGERPRRGRPADDGERGGDEKGGGEGARRRGGEREEAGDGPARGGPASEDRPPPPPAGR